MLKQHPLYPNTQVDDVGLWRYMDFWKFENMLRSASLHFSRADMLSKMDAKEGSLTQCMQNYFDGVLFTSRFVQNLKRQGAVTFGKKTHLQGRSTIDVREELRQRARSHYRYIHDRTYVNCWSINTDESNLMWGSYVTDPPGVAVRTSISRLEQAISAGSEDVYAIPIDYVDHSSVPLNWDRFPGGMSQIVLDMLTKKMKPYQDERELRLVTDILTHGEKWAPNLVGSELDTEKENAVSSLFVKVDLGILIEEVVFHPRSGNGFGELVLAAIDNLTPAEIGLRNRVRLSTIV